MSEHNTCLNCGAEVITKYCGHCGQKAATHRFTMSHLIAHDVIHGLTHLDKGFLYTFKQLFTRPGHALREYLEGKRANHFNAITFLLLILAANVFVQIATGFDLNEILGGDERSKTFLEQLQNFQRKNAKLMYLVSIPASAMVTFVVFRKAKFNFAEHLVINTYNQAMGVLIYTVFILFITMASSIEAKRALFGLCAVVSNMTYTVWLFWQLFRQYYKNGFGPTGLVILMIFLNMIMYTVLGILLFLPSFNASQP